MVQQFEVLAHAAWSPLSTWENTSTVTATFKLTVVPTVHNWEVDIQHHVTSSKMKLQFYKDVLQESKILFAYKVKISSQAHSTY